MPAIPDHLAPDTLAPPALTPHPAGSGQRPPEALALSPTLPSLPAPAPYRSAVLLALLLESLLLAGVALLLSRPAHSPPPDVVQLTLPAPEANAAVASIATKPVTSAPKMPPLQASSPPRPQTVVQRSEPPPPAAAVAPPQVEAPKLVSSEGDPAPRTEPVRSATPAPAANLEPPSPPVREPERPVVQKHEPAAPPPVVSDSVDPEIAAAYHARLTAAVQAAFTLPTVARQMGFKGKVRVEFHLRDGVVSAARIIQGSSLGAVDRAALNAVLSASYPAPPATLQGKDGTYQIWVACY